MKRLAVLLVALVALTSARFERNVNLQAGDTAHCTADALVLTSPTDARCVAFTPTPTATAIAVPTATSTATATPTAAATATGTAAPVPTVMATATPSAVVALCPSHDATAWHALVDTVRNCFYDHEHGDNPHLGDAVFGAPFAQTISYPWATSGMENTHKHGGYKYAVRLNIPCGLNTNRDGIPTPNCITDARIEYHFVSHALDALARYHSYYAEYRVCQGPAWTQCGILRIGGWADLGVMNAPYAGARVYRPGGTIDFGMGSIYGGANSDITMSFSADTPDLDVIAPVGALPCCDEPYASIGSTTQPLNAAHLLLWSLENLGGTNTGHNPWARFLVRSFDIWGGIDPANPNVPLWFCRDGSCDANGSLRALNELSVLVPAAWDTGGGFVDKAGYTNRFGQEVTGCTATGLDCVPFSLAHVPTGAAHREDPQGGAPWSVEYDTAPVGVHWIQFPN